MAAVLTRGAAMYQVAHRGGRYMVEHDGKPACSTLGKPLATAYRLLAEALCAELNRDAAALRAESSVARLHSTYLDCAVLMPRDELESNLLNAYDPAVDFALKRSSDLLNRALMAAWFGPVESSRVLSAWLRSTPLRQLVSLHVCAGAVSSVLVGYRLLRAEIPAPTLAMGVRKYGYPGGQSADDLIGVLERIKCYALVPEEPNLPGA